MGGGLRAILGITEKRVGAAVGFGGGNNPSNQSVFARPNVLFHQRDVTLAVDFFNKSPVSVVGKTDNVARFGAVHFVEAACCNNRSAGCRKQTVNRHLVNCGIKAFNQGGAAVRCVGIIVGNVFLGGIDGLGGNAVVEHGVHHLFVFCNLNSAGCGDTKRCLAEQKRKK